MIVRHSRARSRRVGCRTPALAGLRARTNAEGSTGGHFHCAERVADSRIRRRNTFTAIPPSTPSKAPCSPPPPTRLPIMPPLGRTPPRPPIMPPPPPRPPWRTACLRRERRRARWRGRSRSIAPPFTALMAWRLMAPSRPGRAIRERSFRQHDGVLVGMGVFLVGRPHRRPRHLRASGLWAGWGRNSLLTTVRCRRFASPPIVSDFQPALRTVAESPAEPGRNLLSPERVAPRRVLGAADAHDHHQTVVAARSEVRGRTAASIVSAAAPALTQEADPMSAIKTSLRDASGGKAPRPGAALDVADVPIVIGRLGDQRVVRAATRGREIRLRRVGFGPR